MSKKYLDIPKGVLIGAGIILALGISLVIIKNIRKRRYLSEIDTSAVTDSTPAAEAESKVSVKKEGNALIITGHDSVWDYKYENGIWYTKKKTSSTWLVMKDHLSKANYELAASRLAIYLRFGSFT